MSGRPEAEHRDSPPEAASALAGIGSNKMIPALAEDKLPEYDKSILGGILYVVVVAAAPLLSQWWEPLSFLTRETWRFFLLAMGLGSIAGAEGKAAQWRWTIDKSWSPRVAGHSLAALTFALGTAFCALIWWLALTE